MPVSFPLFPEISNCYLKSFESMSEAVEMSFLNNFGLSDETLLHFHPQFADGSCGQTMALALWPLELTKIQCCLNTGSSCREENMSPVVLTPD